MGAFSEERISHLAHLMVEGVKNREVAAISDTMVALRETKKIITDFMNTDDQIDQIVRSKILSMKRMIPEGSQEWGVLYNKYLEEENHKKGK